MHGPGIGKAAFSPAHALGEGKRGDDGGDGIFQHIQGGRSSHGPARRDVDAFFRLLREQGGNVHPRTAREPLRSSGGSALCVIRRLERRPQRHLLAHGLHVGKTVHMQQRATGRGADGHSVKTQIRLVQRGGETLGKLFFQRGQKTGRQFFRADFKNKVTHLPPSLDMDLSMGKFSASRCATYSRATPEARLRTRPI